MEMPRASALRALHGVSGGPSCSRCADKNQVFLRVELKGTNFAQAQPRAAASHPLQTPAAHIFLLPFEQVYGLEFRAPAGLVFFRQHPKIWGRLEKERGLRLEKGTKLSQLFGLPGKLPPLSLQFLAFFSTERSRRGFLTGRKKIFQLN